MARRPAKLPAADTAGSGGMQRGHRMQGLGLVPDTAVRIAGPTCGQHQATS